MPPDPRLVPRGDKIPAFLQEELRQAAQGPVMPAFLEEELRKAARRRKADEEIGRKWTWLGGAPGVQIGDITEIREGYYRQYAIGRIYYRPGLTACHVLGAIGDRYSLKGGPGGRLGWPTSDQLPFEEGGAVSRFQNGAIYWWPDTGPIPLGDVTVRYTGLACFGETDQVDFISFSPDDEPYVIFCVAPAVPVPPTTVRTRIYGGDDDEYGGVDAGDSRLDSIELYRGLPHGLSLTAVLGEHDYLDADYLRDETRDALEAGFVAIRAAHQQPGGTVDAGFYSDMAEFVGPVAQSGLNIVGSDYIGQVTFPVTAKTMVTMAVAPPKDFRAIRWDVDSPVISGELGSYKVYLSIEAASGP